MNTDPINSAGLSLAQNLGSSRGILPSAAASPTVFPAPADPLPASPSPVGIASASQRAASAAEQDQAKEAAAYANRKLSSTGVPLQFQVELGKQGEVRSIKLFDVQTNQVVMEIPSEAMLSIRDSIDKMIANDANGVSVAGALFLKSA